MNRFFFLGILIAALMMKPDMTKAQNSLPVVRKAEAKTEAAKTYVNIIAVAEGNENNEGIKALVEVLTSDDVQKFINDTYDGAVVPF